MRLRSERDVHLFEVVQQRSSPSYHGVLSERSTTLSPCSADTGMNVRSCTSSLAAKSRELGLDALEHGLVVVDEVHLVDAQHEVRHAEQRREERVPARLLEDAVARVDEDQREVRRSTRR